MAVPVERSAVAAVLLLAGLALRDGGGACRRPSPDSAAILVLGDRAVRVRLRSGGVTLREFDAAPGRTTVDPLPASRVAAHASAGADVVWPRVTVLRGGDVATFTVETLRRVVLRAPESGAGELGDAPILRFVADRTVLPRAPEDRLDALQAWVDARHVETRRIDRRSLEVRLPAVDCWVLGETGGRPVAARLRADDAELTLGPAPFRWLRDPPTVRGRPIPSGTLVAPGRLDLAAAAEVRTMLELREFPGAAVAPPGAWVAVPLADAQVLTLQHPAYGIAYAAWGPGGPADAEPSRGAVAFALRDGERFTGHVAIWPAWSDGRAVFSRPSDRHLRRRAAGVTSLVVRGLPPGIYRYDYAVADGAREPGTVLRRGSVRVEEGHARVVRLEPDP